MAFTLSTIAAKDSAGTAIGGGLLAADKAGGGVGPFIMGHLLVDGVAGTNLAKVDASNRVSMSIDNIAAALTLATITTVGAVTSITNPVTVASHAVTNAGTFAVQDAATAAAIAAATITTVAAGVSAAAVNPILGGGVVSAAAPSTSGFADGDAVHDWRDPRGATMANLVAAGVLIGGDATNGLDVDVTRVPTDPFGANADAANAAGSVSAKLRFIAATGIPITSIAAGTNNIGDVDVLTLPTQGYSAAVSLTRTADTNAYAANDVIGAATGSTAALTFASMGPSGGDILITSAQFEIDVTSVPAGATTFRLYLYNVTPPSALGDNAAFDLPSGDRASYLGYVDLGTPVDLGSTLYVQTSGINTQVKLSGTSLFGYLVTTTGYTPTSAAVKKITLHSVGV